MEREKERGGEEKVADSDQRTKAIDHFRDPEAPKSATVRKSFVLQDTYIWYLSDLNYDSADPSDLWQCQCGIGTLQGRIC